MSVRETRTSAVEEFTPSEAAFLKSYTTNVDKPVFALINMPEVVKGALFARYSRSEKSLRRLLLDEFRDDLESAGPLHPDSHKRAEGLYQRAFTEYGDDSIAQLGSVHLACEGISNVLTKLVERGRLMSYLEQSTRYIPYNDQPSGKWRYYTPAEFDASLSRRFQDSVDRMFSTYSQLLPRVVEHLLAEVAGTSTVNSAAISNERQRRAVERAARAKALDVLRGMLPACTRSNVGIFGSGQAYEQLLMRLRATGNVEAYALADEMLPELRKVIPSFLTRVDLEDRGIAWTEYLRRNRVSMEELSRRLSTSEVEAGVPGVRLVDFDPDGEVKVVAAAMYATSGWSDTRLLDMAREMSHQERLEVLNAYVGHRLNRRHKPGRAFERATYRFDILGDYGSFRDMQRHRILSIDWQTLTTEHGYETPDLIKNIGAGEVWTSIMDDAASVHERVLAEHGLATASYAVPMAYRVRYVMEMNLREAMHVLELRSSPQGHEAYRRLVVEMQSQIAEKAGHRALAASMKFVNRTSEDLERLPSELRREVG